MTQSCQNTKIVEHSELSTHEKIFGITEFLDFVHHPVLRNNILLRKVDQFTSSGEGMGRHLLSWVC
jgi:hypothetical protein